MTVAKNCETHIFCHFTWYSNMFCIRISNVRGEWNNGIFCFTFKENETSQGCGSFFLWWKRNGLFPTIAKGLRSAKEAHFACIILEEWSTKVYTGQHSIWKLHSWNWMPELSEAKYKKAIYSDTYDHKDQSTDLAQKKIQASTLIMFANIYNYSLNKAFIYSFQEWR